MISALLGSIPELDEVDDHQPKEYGTLTRCEVDGQLWPCALIEKAKRLAGIDIALLEMVDVGWSIWTWTPAQLDPRPIGGIVAGYTDEEEAGRVYTVVDWKAGRPITRKIAARDVDTGTVGLPNSRNRIATYRQLCRHVGKQTGSADGTEVLDIAMALALCQATT